MKQRILFLYLTKHSGHYAAAVAVEAAARRLNNNVESMLLDSFSHANPLLSKVTLKAYLAALKTAPEIWEWMYDNPKFKERTAKIRELLNRGNSRKLEKVLHAFNPDVVVCTQAFACGVLASWKQRTGNRRPALVGVRTTKWTCTLRPTTPRAVPSSRKASPRTASGSMAFQSPTNF